MTRSDFKTGMTCSIAKGNRYMIHVNHINGDICLIPISNIYTVDWNKERSIKKGINLNTELILKADPKEDLTDVYDGFYSIDWYGRKVSPYQITKIYHPSNPLDLFHFLEEDLIWSIN